MKSGFLDKLLERLDKLDPESLQAHFVRLVQERGLLETIFQSIQEGVVVIDGTGKLTYANRAAEQLMGFSFDSAKGRPVERYLREIDWGRILELNSDESAGMLSREIEITYPEHRFVSFYIVPLPDDDKRDRGAVAILRDVTRDRENETSMLESERLNAVKLLAAGVAHEIGNPLNALNIHLQLLDREIDHMRNAEPGPRDAPPSNGQQADELKELVQIAKNEVSRLDMIITQFLRAIRPSKPTLVPSRIDSLVKETLTLMKQEIQNRDIDVELDCSQAVPKIHVDRDQIKQAFFNVIKNAIQAMPDGGSLRITLSSSDEFLEVAFQDTGVGIDAEEFGNIFEPYHTTKASGSGLGLMIVQRIVQDHGGQIQVASKPDSGTCFTIHLPLAQRRMRLLKPHDGRKRDSRSENRKRAPARKG